MRASTVTALTRACALPVSRFGINRAFYRILTLLLLIGLPDSSIVSPGARPISRVGIIRVVGVWSCGRLLLACCRLLLAIIALGARAQALELIDSL